MARPISPAIDFTLIFGVFRAASLSGMVSVTTTSVIGEFTRFSTTMCPGAFSVARKKAQYSETRWACCMLCVTMTIVTRLASSPMVSPIRRVEAGSSADHGSSISSTAGEIARARAASRHGQSAAHGGLAVALASAGVQHLEGLREPAVRQAALGGRAGQPAPQHVLEAVHVAGLAHVRSQCRDLTAEYLSDVYVVVRGRGAADPYLPDYPRVEALLAEQVRKGKRVPRVRVDRVQSRRAPPRWSGW